MSVQHSECLKRYYSQTNYLIHFKFMFTLVQVYFPWILKYVLPMIGQGKED